MDDDLDDMLDHESGLLSGGFGPVEAGLAFAFAGHLADQHAGRAQPTIDIHLHPPEEPKPTLINAADNLPTSGGWDTFIGQEAMKRQLKIHIASAKARGRALDHVLLASGNPGVGKTMLARIIAKEMGGEFIMLVPPFHRDTLYEAARSLPNLGILFIDEIHKLADHSPAAAENLLHLLYERRLYLDGGVVKLNDITCIGATTDADKLPETIIDRFVIKPYFSPYTLIDLAHITAQKCGLEGVSLDTLTMLGIAAACRNTPRVAEEFVRAARDYHAALGLRPTIDDLLDFKETEPDGMTRQHKAYLITILSHFRRVTADGEVVYIAGEYALRSLLRETKQGVHRLEKFLMERGYLDRSPQGRRLTAKGIEKAKSYRRET